MRRDARGQILPLFALMLVGIFAMAALAIDVSSAYSARQFYRTAADAAALAGAQDLQGTMRHVTSADYASARTDALASLARQLEPPGQAYVDPWSDAVDPPSDAGCNPSANIASCPIPNTVYQVRITTPVAAGGCASCDRFHSVAVTVTNPSFQLSFARVLGSDHWNVASTAVAGLQFPANYASVTLRPFAPPNNNAGTDPNDDDISLSGGQSTAPTTVNFINGDVGTNSYVVTGSNTRVQLLDGYPSLGGKLTADYRIYHYDQIGNCFSNPTTVCDTWNKDITNSYPVGWKIDQLINDPQYPAASPARPTGPTATLTQAAGSGLEGISSPPTFTCLGAPASLPDGTECFKPGVYPGVFAVTGSAPGVYLEPGVYFFDNGIQIGSGQSLWGGLQSGEPGVAIVVPQTMTGSNKGFDTASATNVVLNSGDPNCADTCRRAAPAKDFNGKSISTTATPQGLPLTIIVPRDESCYTGAVPHLCSDNQNTAVKLAGNSALVVGGVIYAPSDKMQIASNNTAQNGVVGQIIGWTVTYTGHASLNQEGAPSVGGGTLRLDAACTAPGTPCIP